MRPWKKKKKKKKKNVDAYVYQISILVLTRMVFHTKIMTSHLWRCQQYTFWHDLLIQEIRRLAGGMRRSVESVVRARGRTEDIDLLM